MGKASYQRSRKELRPAPASSDCVIPRGLCEPAHRGEADFMQVAGI
jgi:hypothetical protein